MAKKTKNTVRRTKKGVAVVSEPIAEQATVPAAAEKESAAPEGTRSRRSANEAKEKKLSALDAAAQVLQETGQSMTCKELIEALSAGELWTSPRGLTPHATLYAAIYRELKEKGTAARFVKTERGKFAFRNQA